ncbi:MAG: hypothetical protein LBN20_06600 [Endomicrobium sp.]|jgi:hypothetical protein|nr:hypothetical protein [Endomicrobium sp.]
MFETLEEVVNLVNVSESNKLEGVDAINKLSGKLAKNRHEVFMSAYSCKEIHKVLIYSKLLGEYLIYTKLYLDFLRDLNFASYTELCIGFLKELGIDFNPHKSEKPSDFKTLKDFLITKKVISEEGKTQEGHREATEAELKAILSEIEKEQARRVGK